MSCALASVKMAIAKIKATGTIEVAGICDALMHIYSMATTGATRNTPPNQPKGQTLRPAGLQLLVYELSDWVIAHAILSARHPIIRSVFGSSA